MALRVRKGDRVFLITGKDKGKSGKVLKVFPLRDRILIEGLNQVKRHTRPSRKNPQGGIIEKELPLHISNVMLVCPNCNKPTRIGRTFLKDGTKIRICRKCQEPVDKT
ncbi:TPA: 50S ribosomal protein L24 [bacterium]|nr:50S ribosomal protein L24 [bacterium]